MDGPLKGYLWSSACSYEYILGNYEDPETMKTFLSWLKPGSVFYDLGANVGYYALIANRLIDSGKIYSFEPSPAARELFEKHTMINKGLITNNNITLLPFAISDAEKKIEFSNNTVQQEGNTYIKTSGVFTEAEETISVQCHSIDGLMKQGYSKPDMIKIDVEGAEFDVLKGAVETLKQYKPDILLATHDCHLPGVKDRCLDLLRQLGYELKHTGRHNKQLEGLDDYIAIHQSRPA
jgi:FkbM family methyltransferase